MAPCYASIDAYVYAGCPEVQEEIKMEHPLLCSPRARLRRCCIQGSFSHHCERAEWCRALLGSPKARKDIGRIRRGVEPVQSSCIATDAR